MASLFRATSSCDQRSNAHFIDWRSPSRKSGLICRSKLVGSSVADARAPFSDSVASRFGFLILLALEDFFTPAFVVAVALVLLSVQERGFVLMLLVSGFVFAHRASSLRSFVGLSAAFACGREANPAVAAVTHPIRHQPASDLAARGHTLVSREGRRARPATDPRFRCSDPERSRDLRLRRAGIVRPRCAPRGSHACLGGHIPATYWNDLVPVANSGRPHRDHDLVRSERLRRRSSRNCTSPPKVSMPAARISRLFRRRHFLEVAAHAIASAGRGLTGGHGGTVPGPGGASG
jgi:hypothetical protein